MVDEIQDHKQNGVYYTPDVLADYLVKNFIKENQQTILDPAYGNGALLRATERLLNQSSSSKNKFELFGCDTQPVNGLLKHLPEANLLKLDFFDYSISQKHDIILTNPPFVRHHFQDYETIQKYRQLYPELKIVNNSADLWAYFVIKSALHLKKGGSIGAILPWSFLQADYSQVIRKWLYNHFREIKLVSLSNRYFINAEERIIVLWLKKYGSRCKSLKLGFGKDTESAITFSNLKISDWNSDKVIYNGNFAINQFIKKFKSKYKFSEFKNFADIKIGIVTGAVEYFVLSKEKAQEIGFQKRHLIPVINSTREFVDVLRRNKESLDYCIKITKRSEKTFQKYIQEGIKKKYHLRAHSKLREPWYQIQIGKTPDAFFPYRVSKIPYILNNSQNLQSTNSVHRVYFKGLSRVEKMWIEVSLLSSIGQLSLEINSKTYGRGMLKLEPSSIKKTIVLKKKDQSIKPIHKRIISFLKESNKEEAVKYATAFINKKLKIPIGLAASIDKALSDLQFGRFV